MGTPMANGVHEQENIVPELEEHLPGDDYENSLERISNLLYIFIPSAGEVDDYSLGAIHLWR